MWVLVQILQGILNLDIARDALERLMPRHIKKLSEVIERSNLPFAGLYDAHDFHRPQALWNVSRSEVGDRAPSSMPT